VKNEETHVAYYYYYYYYYYYHHHHHHHHHHYVPGRGWEFFSSPSRPEQLWGPHSLISNGYRGRFPWG
jgi:hypothetical protein